MKFRIERFEGLNQAMDELSTGANWAAEAENVSTAGGALSSCKAPCIYADAPLEGGVGTLATYFARRQGQTQRRLVAVNAARIAEWTGEGWSTAYEGAGAAKACALNYQHDGADVLLIADGMRPVLRWDEGGMAPLAGCDKRFGQLALHYERVWGSALEGEPDAVYWSRAFDPGDWTGDLDNPDAGGGMVLIPTWNGGRVVALRALFGDVLVFKDEDLYRIVGTYPGNYEVVRAHGVVGPVAPESIVAAADTCYFLSRDGLCAYNGISAAPVGDGRARRVFARVNRQAAQGACAALWNATLYLALPLDASAHNNAVLEIDLERGTQLLRTGLRVDCLLPFGDALLFGGGDGRIHQYGAQGAAAGAFWRTPWQDMNAPGARKYFAQLSMFASGTFEVRFQTDSGGVRRRLRLGNALRPVVIPLGVSGRRFALTIVGEDGAQFSVAPGLTLDVDVDG